MQAVFSRISIIHNLDHSIWQALSRLSWKTANVQLFYDAADRDRMINLSAGRKDADKLEISNSEVVVQYYAKTEREPRQLLRAELPELQWDLSQEKNDQLRSVTIPGASLSTIFRYSLLDVILDTISKDRSLQSTQKRIDWSKNIAANVGMALQIAQELSGSNTALPELQVRRFVPRDCCG